MQTIFDGYKPIYPETPTYFAGANTAGGFSGDYDTIADEKKLERVYVIKGGAGTGKSTLMRQCAYAAEQEGFPVWRYLCGSDPDSLDCVVLDGRIALLDGTAPHTRDMLFPGAASSLIDVSPFWNSRILEERRTSIEKSTGEKAASYASAYRYFAAAERIEKNKRAMGKATFLWDKAEAAIGRLIKKWEKNGDAQGKGGTARSLYTHALTMKGAFRLENALSAQRYVLREYFGCAPLFMELLRDMLVQAGHSILVSCLPVPGVIASIYVEDCGVLLTVGEEEGEKILNMARFMGEVSKGEFRLASRIQRDCLEEGKRYLAKAAVAHFSLEKEYTAAMDFEGLRHHTEGIRSEIMERLMKKAD